MIFNKNCVIANIDKLSENHAKTGRETCVLQLWAHWKPKFGIIPKS